MTAIQQQQTRRGFVMTGGGAKGLYEAGVIHAFHLCGMEFDVITGSSIGAINSVFYAEYQYRKQQLPAEILNDKDPLPAIEAMDPLVRTFLHVWWNLPEFRIIDDSDAGPLGQLKNDLLEFNLTLPQVVRLLWWWTDPKRNAATTVGVWPQILQVLKESVERLGSGREFWQEWMEGSRIDRPFRDTILRAYLARFGIEYALVPDEAADRLKLVFTEPETPLQTGHLTGGKVDQSAEEAQPLLDSSRTLRDYADAGIEVRLTRANYRTGRLEVSRYVSPEQFIHYLRNHAWRWQQAGKRAIALGSERLYLLGNPNAVAAALGSGRFPGVFAPMPVDKIYDLQAENGQENDEENLLLDQLLQDWLHDDELKQALLAAYKGSDDLENRFQSWRSSQDLQQLFPRRDDMYVDGGTIDNTPSNSAIDAVKDWVAANKRAAAGDDSLEEISLKDVTLDLYTVFLHPSPDPGHLQLPEPPASYQVVQRALQIRDAATLASNATDVGTISYFGDRAEELGEIAAALAGGLADTLDNLPEDLAGQLDSKQRDALLKALQARLAPWLKQAAGITGSADESAVSNLQSVTEEVHEQLNERLPLHVTPVEIYPDTMPMDTLQFTERLGYRPENAIAMMTIGCYNTLWELREHLENKSRRRGVTLDAIDQRALDLARFWTGFDDWPNKRNEPEKYADLHKTWACQRKTCVFYAQHCAHGACQQKASSS